jgi:F0F1-type ATP synthase delta subunit
LTCEGRLEEKDHILRDVEFVLAENDYLIVRLKVARDLNPVQLKAIEQALQRHFQVKHIELKSEVDPELIGGLVISTPLGSADSSLTNQLASLVRGEK